ncbi:TetR family transcriptional regulator [Sphingomonas adhaesiva]|uniref:TetR family transcriptional regulator n=1 Tax=Sphingomonas adhaesiva TaxID=28212 RepID=UPI002FF87EA6
MSASEPARPARRTSRRGRRDGADSASATALVKATAALMRERDTLDVSFVEIAERAGLPAGLIGYYFGNKEGLLFAVLERDVKYALAQLDALVASDWSPVDKMRLHLRGVVRAYYKTPYFNRLVQAMTRDASPERVARIAAEFIGPMTKAQGAIMDEGVADGLFREVDRMLFYFSVIGAADAIHASRFILSSVYGVAEVTPDLHRRHAAHIAEVFLHTLLIDPASAAV